MQIGVCYCIFLKTGGYRLVCEAFGKVIPAELRTENNSAAKNAAVDICTQYKYTKIVFLPEI